MALNFPPNVLRALATEWACVGIAHLFWGNSRIRFFENTWGSELLHLKYNIWKEFSTLPTQFKKAIYDSEYINFLNKIFSYRTYTY